MKKCFKCGQEKARSEFYAHKMMGDGLLGKCKACTKTDVTKNRGGKLEEYRAYDRRRGNRQTSEYRRAYGKRYRREFPLAYIAQKIYQNANRRGEIEHSPCSVCGNTKSQGHHEDYRKPMEVVWLCPLHHRRRHLEIKAQGIDLHDKF